MLYSLAFDESTDVQGKAQLLLFIPGIKTCFELTEKLLSVEPLKDTTTDQDFFNVVENCVSVEQDSKCNNRWGACFDLKNVGLVKLVKNKIKEEHSDHTLLPINCVIHQESLYKVVLNINHVINPVVSVMKLIKARALNHEKFRALLEDF